MMITRLARLAIPAVLLTLHSLVAGTGGAARPVRPRALPAWPEGGWALAAALLPACPVRKQGGRSRRLAFSHLGRRLSAVRTPKAAAQVIVDTADALFGWDACALALCSSDAAAMIPVLCMDVLNGQRAEITPDADSGKISAFARQVLKQGAQLVLRPEPAAFPPDGFPFGDKTRASASLMYVPVRKDSVVIGLLSIQSYSSKAYTRQDLLALQALADQCGGALERIRAEAALNQELERRVQARTAQLEAINRELEAFAYSVSHDLRAPLRSICGFSEVVLERYADRLDSLGQEYLRRASASGHQMERLIDDLLKLSRASQSELRRQVVNLSALVASLAAELRRAEPARAVQFVIATGLQAEGDERLLRVALDNLLRNAWKFTSRAPKALIEFGRVTEPASAFFVRDNGVGFDPAYAGKLFGVFQRLHGASDFPGTGIGLATVRRIIARHAGRTWATSAVNQGASFYFTLPGTGGSPL